MKTAEKVLAMARRQGILRPKDLREAGVHPENLRRLCSSGKLRRSARGLYVLADRDVSPNIAFAQAAKWLPHGVICLLSALRFHEIGTQNPFEVWIALDRRARTPRIQRPPLRVMRFSGKAFTSGIGEHRIEGVSVRIYSPAKTVVDCFKYRNKIGIDVAIEALRGAIQSRKCTLAQIREQAEVCRVTKVMTPYLEAVL